MLLLPATLLSGEAALPQAHDTDIHLVLHVLGVAGPFAIASAA